MTASRGSAEACRCVLHDPSEDNTSWDSGQQKVVADVERYGWHVRKISEDGSTPGWAFTVGLWHTFGHPEVAMFGLRVPDMGLWLDAVGEQVRRRDPMIADEHRLGILENHPVLARRVHASWYPDLFNDLNWFAQQALVPILQVVWPDREGRFPWEESSGQRCRVDQPQLWIPQADHATGPWTRLFAPEDWPFPDGPETLVISTKRVIMEDRAVIYVVHEPGGGWQFLDGEDVTVESGTMVHLDHLLVAHPRLAEVGDLAPGWEAEYEPPDGVWVRRPVPPEVWLDP